MGKIFNIKILSFSVLLVVLFLSIGYSAFNTSLVFEDMGVNIRAEADIRVTGIGVESGTAGVLAESESYDINKILAKFTLPSNTSTITYRIKITNFGSPEMGIYELTGLPDYLDYSLSNYTLKEKLCDSSGKCNLGIVKDDILITIKYKDQTVNPTITNHNISVSFDFKEIYSVTYTGITNNGYPTEIMSGETLNVKFTNSIPYNVVAYIDGVKDYDKYTYSNGILTIENVTGNLLIQYVSKAYLTTLSQGTYFKESTYLTSIKTVQFVDYIEIPSDSLATYDLSENTDGSIIGWIDKDYNLYIGSDWKIYSKTLANAFRGMSGVASISFGNLNTNEATSIRNMFRDCSGLTTLDLSSFNTSNVTDMGNMFYGMSSLTTLDLSNFNTSNVTNMASMFRDCQSLTSLDISNFNTAKVTTFSYMFYNCRGLTTLDLSNFNTSNVTNMESMFQYCTHLTSLDVSSFNTSKVTDMIGMFAQNFKLTSLDVSNFDTSNVMVMQNMFTYCLVLTTLDLSSFDTSKVTNMNNMFKYATDLTTIYVSDRWSTAGLTQSNQIFVNNISLVGQSGTKYSDSNSNDQTYAIIDGGTSSPGYFTYKEYVAQ